MTAEEEKHARPRFREHPLEAFLGIFGDVRPGEGATVVLLAINIFILLAAYYLLKVAREQLILIEGGAAVKSYSSAGQTILLAGVASFYGWLAGRVGRLALITIVTVFFATNLIVFWLLGERGVHLGIPFFLWVGIFNIVTTTQFYSFAADLYSDEQGKRLFPVVGIGGSVGAVGGAALADGLVHVFGSPYLLMLVAAGVLLSSLGLTFIVDRRDIQQDSPKSKKIDEAPLASGNAFALAVRDRYLIFILVLVFVLNVVTKTGDFVLDSMLVEQAPRKAAELGLSAQQYIGEFKARYFEWINVLGVVLQLFAVSRIIKYFGIRVALVLVPIASLGGYGAALFAPFISVLFVSRIVESSLDYSLSNTTRQALWLVTSREAKYKAKQVIDTFIVRFGDAASAGLVWVGLRLELGARAFLAINVGFSVAWVLVALALEREYAKRGGTQKAKQVAPAGAA